MLLEHLVVGLESAPPTTAELCTTSVNIVGCWEVRSSSKWIFLFLLLFRCFLELRWLFLSMDSLSCGSSSLLCVGHTAVFCGNQGRLRLRGASVSFWSAVVWWKGGSLVCLWLDVWREARSCGYGYMSGFIGWVYTHMRRRSSTF